MKHIMLINAVHMEQKRMAIVEDGKLVEFNIQMSLREPITGNIYKGIVLKVERGLQAAFVNFGVGKDGFLPLRDVSPDYFTEKKDNGREGSNPRGTLKTGQEVIVQVAREVSGRKGALLTTYLSLPGRYLVLLPNKHSSGISRKIEDEEDRKLLKTLVEQIKIDEGMGFIVRTAGINRTKQELSRDYQHLLRLWKEIQKSAETEPAPALIYQESDFGVRSLRDYFTSEIEEILVDDIDTYRKMRAYCKTVVPRNLRMIKQYKERLPVFGRYNLEEQIREIYQERVELKSGGSIVICPTEAMITIDVNSGRGSNKKNVEDTAFKTNLEAAEEIARQLRLRDLGGLIAIDFIDMMDRKHEAEVEKTFKKALTLDRARIQLSRISKFGILELSRQKKHSTIQEISYTACPFCTGRGVRPSLEYTALSAFRKIESEAAKEKASALKVTVPHEIADYLLNQKRSDIQRIESMYDLSVHVSGKADMIWDHAVISAVAREVLADIPETTGETKLAGQAESASYREVDLFVPDLPEDQQSPLLESSSPEEQPAAAEPAKKKSRRRPRRRRRKPEEKIDSAAGSVSPQDTPENNQVSERTETDESSVFSPPVLVEPIENKPSDSPFDSQGSGNHQETVEKEPVV
ncbi:RNAse E [Syntrophus gentianae]|uniref:Ribonuclease G n=1 Tax=Syntrophus gentianae TaxID=43775 RepID=A0A1H7XVI7_9BACT|nr:Rne/Rng family ribonuclease [Syntrophus gentianae]SEM37906.1 RNAse E [Syntrophus gentianae]